MTARFGRSILRGERACVTRYALTGALFWPIAGVMTMTIDGLVARLMGSPGFLDGPLWAVIGWLEWLLLTPAVVVAALAIRRFPVRSVSFFAAHGICASLTTATHAALFYALRILTLGEPGAPGLSALEAWVVRMDSHLELDLLVYALTVIAVHAALLLRRMAEEERESEELHRRIARAELELLKLQLPQELLVEMLLRIETLATSAAERAEFLMTRLSRLLRSALALSRTDGSLRDELVMAEHFAQAAAGVRDSPLRVHPFADDVLSCAARSTKLMLPILVSVWADAGPRESAEVSIDAARVEDGTEVSWTIRGVSNPAHVRSLAATVAIRLPPTQSIQIEERADTLRLRHLRGAGVEEELSTRARVSGPAPPRLPRRSPALLAVAMFAVPPLEALLVSLLAITSTHLGDRPPAVSPLLAVWPAAVSTPVGLLLAAFAYRRRREHRRLGTLLAVGTGAAIGPFACLALSTAVLVAFSGEDSFLDLLRRQLTVSYRTTDFLLFSCIGIGALAYGRQVASDERRFKNRVLDEQLARTHAQTLKDQLNPHFLFNALNSILALLDRNPQAAALMTARLRAYLGLVLSMAERQEVPLDEELECTLAYLEIEKVRFGGRLTVTVDIEPAARRALVPNLLLQPLIENAVRHGLAPIQGGAVSVDASIRDDRLTITVRDNGRGARDPVRRRNGLGLQNVEDRLRQLHADAVTIVIDHSGAGYGVTITLPFRSAAL